MFLEIMLMIMLGTASCEGEIASNRVCNPAAEANDCYAECITICGGHVDDIFYVSFQANSGYGWCGCICENGRADLSMCRFE